MPGLITTAGRKIFLDRTYTPSPTRTAPTVFQIGTGTTVPTAADTAMENRIPITGEESLEDCETANFTGDNADMTTSLNTTNFKEGLASINLTKDGGASTTASTDKTEAGTLDFTSKELHLWILVNSAPTLALLATTDAITIRIGSDASNYYQWTKDKSFFSVGFTYIDGLTVSNATTVGSPVATAIDFIFIAVETTLAASTYVAGEVAMDNWIFVEEADFKKTFEVGFPSLDFNILEATIRSRVNTLQANGHNITEYGIFNTDGTEVMKSRDTFTAISKTSTDELIFQTKTLIE